MRRPDEDTGRFSAEIMDSSVIALPLLKSIQSNAATRYDGRPPTDETPYRVIMDLNRDYVDGIEGARSAAAQLVALAISNKGNRPGQGIQDKGDARGQYLYATLFGDVILEFVRLDGLEPEAPDAPSSLSPVYKDPRRTVHRIWPDFAVRPLIVDSKTTVKADAGWAAFDALGADIVWAVVDSGIDKSHPHFLAHANLSPTPPLQHMDYLAPGGPAPIDPPIDPFGHGTHVAGIIAGELTSTPEHEVQAYRRQRDAAGNVGFAPLNVERISGMAPRCTLVSFRVLDDSGGGNVSDMIAALQDIQKLNDYGRNRLIHGVNLSVGYDFDPEWFGCGQSPLCVEVDRLVRQGVVVVVASGNSGYGYEQTAFRGVFAAGLPITINDPGNAELTITVGSTHRTAPHLYGVSYFSSKGPTGDGRPKPDLVAPGEKILSCAAGKARAEAETGIGGPCNYIEDSGTSMAAPHVAGVVAAFLSVRREFIGRPEDVKEIFTSTATDLKRERSYQGFGLVDLMRALQSV